MKETWEKITKDAPDESSPDYKVSCLEPKERIVNRSSLEAQKDNLQKRITSFEEELAKIDTDLAKLDELEGVK